MAGEEEQEEQEKPIAAPACFPPPRMHGIDLGTVVAEGGGSDCCSKWA